MKQLLRQYGGKADENDIAYAFSRADRDIVGAIPAPITKYESGKYAGKDKINPHVTLFKLRQTLLERMLGKEAYMAIYHIKPIYYLHTNGQWRPLSEVTTYAGNKRIDLIDNWDEYIDLRYLAWLLRRMEVIGGSIAIPSPYKTGVLLPLRRGVRYGERAATIAFTTTDFYPDADPESTTVDGRVQWFSGSGVWSTAHAATDGTGADSSVSSTYLQCYHRSGSNLGIDRAFTLFDTASLTSGATISSGTLSLYTDDKGNAEADGKDYFSVVSTTPATNTNLVVGDFDQCGDAVTNPTKGSSDVDVDTITTNQYFALTLNATGLGWISKTGITKLGVREGHDIENEDPNGGGDGVYIHWFCAEYTGTTRDPKLSVTYTVGTNYTKSLTESVTLVEIVSRQIGKAVVDTIALVENKILSMGRTITDVVVLAETTAIATIYTKVFTDAIDIAETVARQAGKAITDTLTLAETTARAISRTITDAVVMNETLQAAAVYIKSITDAITLAETTAARISGKAFTEAITLAETVATATIFVKDFVEQVVLVETTAYMRSMYRTLTDSITIQEIFTKVFVFGRQLTDSIGVTDHIRGLLNGVNMLYGAKYVQKTLSYFNKYLDPK